MTRASAPRFGLLSEGFVLGPFVLALLVLAPTLAWAGAGAAHGSPGPAAAGSLPATAPSAETSRAEDRRGEQLPEVAGAVGAPVAWMRVSSPIHPVVERYLELTLDRAREAGSQVLVVQLDTPGGSVASTRKLSQAFLGAELPVVVYVAPSGAQAASAGFFLLLAADVAAMAPGTNTGSAHPVSGGGGDIEGDMGEKLEQDTLALVRSLAGRHGRDADLAQTAVSESRSFTAEEALAAGLVDLVAADRQSLLTQLDGREVVRPEGEAIVLRTAGAAVIEHPIPAHLRLLAAIAHPQIAGILMALGLLGLYMELSNPGLLVPGITGAIFVILGFFALSVLPINHAGFALLALALVLFVVETQVPTFGVATAGGAVSLALGISMLFEDLDPSLRLHPAWAIGLGILAFVAAGYGSLHTLRARRRSPATGREGLLGERGVARTRFEPVAGEEVVDGAADPPRYRGRVFVHGELWTAESSEALAAGAEVEVAAVHGLRLEVVPAHRHHP